MSSESFQRHWRDAAACLDEDPELFFPIGEVGLAVQEQVAEAKQVCLRCPVMYTCRQWALDTGQNDGVWGALSEQERRSLKRRSRRHGGQGDAGVAA